MLSKGTKESLAGLGDNIKEALITSGISVGMGALARPKKEKEKKDNKHLSGFSQIKFGRKTREV